MSADPEDFGSENLAHVIPIRNEPQRMPPASLDDDCWKHDYQELEICRNCGVAREVNP